MSEPATGEAVAVRIAPELDALARVGKWLAAAEKENPTPDDVAAAAALRLYIARELGLPPLAGLSIGIVKGKIQIPAELYRGLANMSGYRVVRVEGDDTFCTAALLDSEGEVIGESTFTIEQARRAGLIRQGGGWTTYPERMLWARASKFVVQDYAPHVALGFITEDEGAEVRGEPAPEPDEDAPEPIVVDEAEWSDVTPDDLGALAHEGADPEQEIEPCANCGGSGVETDGEPCHRCGGSGNEPMPAEEPEASE